ncbi:PREDICTED: origin recognition complex subunit 6 isoform X1 [Papilio xuthus]|uniref:Origin recognition complex subunit 6 isoform X1 n=1 Tax=Papilio xuthus TaxID=66420 RepID=A0AAJ7ELR0_PAPXU|nr:PREDICTED: origin recognition complex subunit 6 isoform X1 [Papilio xuthus]
MTTYNKTLRLLASKLGLQDEEKVLRKAAELERLLQTKTIAGSNITDNSKMVICLDLAANIYGVDLDLKTAVKYSGLKQPTYVNSRKILENLLELNDDKISISFLCISLQCTEVQALAEDILEEYKKKSKMDIDINLPQYVCMAVYHACRINKVKITKSKIIEKSRMKPSQWSKLDAEWSKFVNDNFASVKKTKGRPRKEEIEVLDINNGTENKTLIKEELIDLIEPYDVWKKRILEEAYKELMELEEIEKAQNVMPIRRSPRKTPQKTSPYKTPIKGKGIRLLFPRN